MTYKSTHTIDNTRNHQIFNKAPYSTSTCCQKPFLLNFLPNAAKTYSNPSFL
jgi:hypothetical protein